MAESQSDYAEWAQPGRKKKGNTLYDSIYIKF